MNILPHGLSATWLIGNVVKIHMTNYLRKAFRYGMDYPRGKIATWVIYHVAKLPYGYSTGYCNHVTKIQVFFVVIVEIMSALHAVNFGLELGFLDVLFEGDFLQVVHDLNMASPLSLTVLGIL